MAFPAEQIRVEMLIDSSWTDVTSDVLGQGDIQITSGRFGENARIAPGSMNISLRDDARSGGREAGRYVNRNPSSIYYGKLGRNTQIRAYLRPGSTGDGDLADVTDTFEGRTSTSGWGTSTSGATWGTATIGSSAGTDWTVSGGAGGHYVDSAVEARISYPNGLTSVTDASILVTGITFPQATGGNLEPANIMYRWDGGGTFGLVRIEVNTAHQVIVRIWGRGNTTTELGSTTTSITHTGTGQPLSLRVRVIGRSVFAKVWVTSGSEPGSWTLTATDEEEDEVTGGRWAIRTGRGSGNTNTANPTVTYGSIEIVTELPLFTGEAAVWRPTADQTDTAVTTDVQAAGVLRRLTSGAKPLESAVRRYITRRRASVVYAYWPLEDGSDATRFSNFQGEFDAITIGPNMFNVAADSTSFPGSAPLPTLGTAYFASPPIQMPDTGLIAFGFLMAFPAAGFADGSEVCWIGQVPLSGSVTRWQVLYHTGGGLRLRGLDSSGTEVVTGPTWAFGVNGMTVKIAINLTRDGFDTDYQFFVTDPENSGGAASGTFVGAGPGVVTRFGFNGSGAIAGATLGHLVISNTSTSVSQFETAPWGYNGETAAARIARLCEEEGVLYEIKGAPDTLMGPQRIATLFDNLNDVELVDLGMLYEPRSFVGVGYIGREALTNQTPAGTLTYATTSDLSEQLEPVDDDLPITNYAAVSRYNGATAVAEQTTGPLSTAAPPTGVGLYDQAWSVAAYSDDQLPSIAGWAVRQGTWDEYRFQRLAINFARKSMPAALLTAGIGSWLTLAGMPAWLPRDEVDQIIRGYVIIVSNSSAARGLILRWSTAPAGPYYMPIVDGDDFRVDVDSRHVPGRRSTLPSGITSSATSFSVASSIDPWVTDAAEFPMLAFLGGEVVTVTAISGASSPQTFTVTRGTNGVTKAHAVGTEIYPLYPAVVDY